MILKMSITKLAADINESGIMPGKAWFVMALLRETKEIWRKFKNRRLLNPLERRLVEAYLGEIKWKI